jgi:hypothetical protein
MSRDRTAKVVATFADPALDCARKRGGAQQEKFMTLQIIGRLAGTLALTVTLAGCIDVTMDVKVKNATEATGTMTQTIAAQFYPMIKASASSDSKSGSFCSEKDKGTLVENADGSATCTIVKDGKFADLAFDDGKESVTFTSPGPGLVRVAWPTKELSSGLDAAAAGGAASGAAASGAASDAEAKKAADQMKAAMGAYFAGHFLTLSVSGGEITDTNMTLAGDKQSASDKIPFTDLLNGTAKFPDELYAVVKVN